jgi:hypothetical protein
MKLNIKHKYAIIIASAIGLIFLVKLGKIDGLGFEREKQEIEELHQNKDSLIRAVDDIVLNIKEKEEEYAHEIDSLNNIVESGVLDEDSIAKIQQKIKRVRWLLEKEREKDLALVSEPVVDTVVVYKTVEIDSIVYNIEIRDSIIYNIEVRDSIIYNIIEKNKKDKKKDKKEKEIKKNKRD